MTKKKDYNIINSKKCQRKGCDWESYAIINAKFLCEVHFREIRSQKERRFRHQITRGILGEKFKVTLK